MSGNYMIHFCIAVLLLVLEPDLDDKLIKIE